MAISRYPVIVNKVTHQREQRRGFHNDTQNLVTNVHHGVWNLIPLLMKEEILVKKKKVNQGKAQQTRKEKKKPISIKHYK